MWNFLTISVLSGICLSFLILTQRWGEHLPFALPYPPPPLPSPLDPSLIKEYFVKLAVWLVVVVGIAVAKDFSLPALVLSGISLFIF